MKLLAITTDKVTVELSFGEVEDIALGLRDLDDEISLGWRETLWWPTIEWKTGTP